MPQIGRLTTEAVQALIEAALPWNIPISVFQTPKTQVNWTTVQLNGALIYLSRLNSSGAQNDQITWDIVLAKGTWTFDLLHCKLTDRGIYSIQFDSVEVASIDGYYSDVLANALSTITGIVIPATKKIEIKLKMATKNASSGGYYGSIQGINLMRTA